MLDYKEYFCFEDIEKAKRIQEFLAKKVILRDEFEDINWIGGADTSFSEKENRILGIVVILEFKTLKLLEISYSFSSDIIPYIPGFLSFREGLAILKAWEKIKMKPQILIIDGQGIAHPRGLGIASHIGVILNIPTIGCAKSNLVGNYKEPGKRKGDFEPIFYKGKKVGIVLRSKDNVKPIFISPGNKISLETSLEIILKTITKYRIPEPIRLAHYYSKVGWLKFEKE